MSTIPNQTNPTPADEPSSYYAKDLDVGDNLHALRFDKATKEIVDWGRSIDSANAERERVAAMLGELAKLADGRGALDVHVAAALKTVAKACDISPQRLRAAVADALDTERPA